MARTRGANLKLAGAFETGGAGVTPAAGTFYAIPIVSTSIGEERGLLQSDLIGVGREMQDPTYDVANDVGDFVVPVDNRNFGRWLKLMLGNPTSAGAPAYAAGTITFASQPTANSTITINGVAFTFVTGTATGNQIQIGANLAATLTNAAAALNGSTVAGVAQATYSASATVLTATYDLPGTGGNTFTIAAGSSPASNGTTSGATLAGGAVATHTFTSGAASLPSMSVEVGHPEIPSYSMHYGIRGNTLRLSAQRSGLLNATVGVIAQGEANPVGATAAGTPTVLAAQRFAQATGTVSKDGVVLANVVSFDATLSNNLETIETIQADGRIADADPGMFEINVSLTLKFADLTLLNLARNGTPCQITFGWVNGPYSLLFTIPRFFLPVPKRSISGPNGIQAEFAGQGSGQSAASLTVTLVNDVANYTA